VENQPNNEQRPYKLQQSIAACLHHSCHRSPNRFQFFSRQHFSMPTVRGGARLTSAPSDRLATSQPYGGSTEQFPKDSPAERMNFKRHPRFLLKCFAIVVCGSVSLIAISVFVWAYDRNLQADIIRSRSDLEHKLLAMEANLKESEFRNAKLIEDCSAKKSANLSTDVLKGKNPTKHEVHYEADLADRVPRETQTHQPNIILPRTHDAPW
jgi:hypothetical protein